MMQDHGMHDGHQGMDHDHSANGNHGADPSAHAEHDGSAMGHMQDMMHSMTVSSA